MQKTSNLREKIKSLPHKPGVYLFKDASGEVIYVGKAKDLKKRVSQYFQGKDERRQLPFLMREAKGLDYTVVKSELESLFLENTLIKRHYPKYNIDLKDDKNYAFITVDYSSEIPQIGYLRKFDPENKQVRYFGPYSAAHKIKTTLRLLREVFPYCAAKKVSSRPCFYYYLHRCPGVCVGKVSLEEYREQLASIEAFLKGRATELKRRLKRDMARASRRRRFEQAARTRDQMRALELFEERQSVILPKPADWDVVGTATESGFLCVNLFLVRSGKLQDRESFVVELKGQDPKTASDQFLARYYLETSNLPRALYLDTAVEGQGALSELLRSRAGRKVQILVPERGKAKELVDLSRENASEYLDRWLGSRAETADRLARALKDLQVILKLPTLPRRIECFDNSNIQGSNPVSSMVVFEDGKPKKSEYRKFKIKLERETQKEFPLKAAPLRKDTPPSGVPAAGSESPRQAGVPDLWQGLRKPDDFAAMEETLGRRLGRLPGRVPDGQTAWDKPDLIVVDGGKSQLSAALGALKKAGVDIPVVGLAKRIEEVFVPEKAEPITLPHSHPALQLLQRLRDEAHRFGITFHRSLRSKEAVRSALDAVAGVGPKTKKLLKAKFGSVKSIRAASLEELSEVVGPKLAQTLKRSL